MDRKKYMLKIIILSFIILSFTLLSACTKKSEGKPASESTKNPKELVKKLDESKPYVYDLEFYKDASVESYLNESSNKTHYAKDMKLPFINVDSPYAKNVNEKILSISKECLEYYNKYSENRTMGYISVLADFVSTEKDGILSIRCFYDYQDSGLSLEKDLTINIDLKTGKEISFNEILKIKGLEDSYWDKIETYLYEDAILTAEVMREVVPDNTGSGIPGNMRIGDLLGSNLKLYWTQLENNTQKWFINDKGFLILAGDCYTPAGGGVMSVLINIEKIDEKKEFINPAWEAYEIPDDKLAAMIFLGYAHNKETRVKINENIKKIREKTNLYKEHAFETPSLLFINKSIDMDGYSKNFVDGNEYFLFIPKYMNATLSKVPIELTDKEIEELFEDQYWVMDNFYAGNSVLLCNVSDLRRDTKFIYKYRDTEFTFSPYIDLGHGDGVYPDQIFNLAEIIDLDKMQNIGEDEMFKKRLEWLK